jgi:hypothetical protein
MKQYNISVKPKYRTSLKVDNQNKIGFPILAEAKNKASAKEIAETIINDYYNDYSGYMAKQYIYTITTNI